DLKPADRQLLEKAYGKLPEPQPVAARTESPTLRPAPTPSKTPVPTPSSKAPDSPKAKMEKEDISGLLAFAGFNDRRGLGAERTRKAPYSMGISNGAGGIG
ncbi:MAG TPA: hypothetical protein VLA12_22035, partial [Planctomycetaceae bacterium]|nr:hypothetical protein [Planctomycetaceae bacterium]